MGAAIQTLLWFREALDAARTNFGRVFTRASRAEFAWTLVLTPPLVYLMGLWQWDDLYDDPYKWSWLGRTVFSVQWIVILALCWNLVAVHARRVHDIGYVVYRILIWWIPLTGGLYIVSWPLLFILKSQSGLSEWGYPPAHATTKDRVFDFE